MKLVGILRMKLLKHPETKNKSDLSVIGEYSTSSENEKGDETTLIKSLVEAEVTNP